VPQRVSMHGKRKTSALTDALYKPIDGVRCERPSALSGEHECAVRELPVQLPQSPQLVASERMNGRLVVLCSAKFLALTCADRQQPFRDA
jgi:hypothetical protein